MSKRLTPAAHGGQSAVVGMVLAGIAVAVVLASGARAADPPIVTAGVGSDGTADACVNGQHSGADPSAEPTSAAQVNDASCQEATGSSTGGGSRNGSAGSSSSSGSAGSSSETGGGIRSTNRGGRTASKTWVTAGSAVGLQIVRVRFDTSRVSMAKRLGVLVTLRDARGRLVRNAIVSISRAPGARASISGTYASFSNRLGQARVSLPAARKMLGKRLYLKISARTPAARALTLRSVRLPGLGGDRT